MRFLLCLVVVTSMVSGCATVTRGTKDVLVVETDPVGAKAQLTNSVGAKAQLTNGMTCEATPCSFKVPRKSEFDVILSKDGYIPAQVHVTHKAGDAGGMALAGNVLVGGIIGAGVDAGTGAMMDLIPNPVVVELQEAR